MMGFTVCYRMGDLVRPIWDDEQSCRFVLLSLIGCCSAQQIDLKAEFLPTVVATFFCEAWVVRAEWHEMTP